jgi:hypothetical protein
MHFGLQTGELLLFKVHSRLNEAFDISDAAM